MESILSIQHLSKRYGNHLANDDIELEIPKGAIFGLLGPNGAGKTTLIRTITQIIGIDQGKVFFSGEPLKPPHTSRIGYMPEERGLYKQMKVGEHLVYLARLKDMSRKEAQRNIHAWMEKFGIEDWWGKRIEELSKGMQQKIQFIATVVHEPELIILDEPFSGLDPINTNLIKDEIHELQSKGSTIIFSTHRMEQVEEICEQIALINKGRKILDGNVAELKQRFKDNLFELEFEGTFPDQLPDYCQLISKNGSAAQLQLADTSRRNELLRFLLDQSVDLVSYNEILPTLNEIFIKQVAQHADA